MKEELPSPADGYIGRFAPSPTGPLHFGSLVAAVGSYLEARCRGGRWHLRIEDVDRPRTVAGAERNILRTLEAYGLEWDGPVVRQSRREADYRATLERLAAAGASYPCSCSRREIRAAGIRGPAGFVYPGTCRGGLPAGRTARSWRLRVSPGPVRFRDRLRGPVTVDVAREIGDFVVRRADGLFAYHLAMVVDDADLGVTDVVRGADLLDCTAPQIVLQRTLGLPTPRYLHLPVAVNGCGQKLSKQTHAPAADGRHAPAILFEVLGFLGHPPPADLHGAPPREMLGWARAHWDRRRLPGAASLPAPPGRSAEKDPAR